MFYLISTLWFIRQTKAILFWLYLWQLKEYHIGRFIDHFRTEKGKQLILNKLLIFKVLLALVFLYGFFLFGFEILTPQTFTRLYFFEFFVRIPFLILILYIFEAVHALFGFFEKKIKKPVLTKKTFVLISVSLILQVLFVFSLFFFFRDPWGGVNFILAGFWLLIFDVLTPAIASGIVLLFQPLAALMRWRIIQKAKIKRAKFRNLLCIGITGSYGKTSTKEFLAEILSEKFKVLKTKEHQNSEVGISQCILNDLKEEHETRAPERRKNALGARPSTKNNFGAQVFVVEMGAYNRGGIKLLCDIAKPKIGIVTGVNEQHLSTFGSMENLLSAEGGKELIESLPDDGLAIFNGNNKYCLNLYPKTQIKKRIISIPRKINSTIVENIWQSDLWAGNIKVEKEQVEFKVFSRDDDFSDFKVNLLGKQNIENILLAACCAKELGMSLAEISKASQKIKIEQSGMKLIKTKEGLNIIDSTYSANPNGVMAHLEYLKIWSGKKAIIMPCLIELGRASKEIHRRIGEKIGQVCDLAIITTKERFKEIEEAAFAKATASQRKVEIIFIENPKEIIERIKNFCEPGDVVLLESRVPKELVGLLSY